MRRNLKITGSSATLASNVATSTEFGGCGTDGYSTSARLSRIVKAVKNNEAISTKAV